MDHYDTGYTHTTLGAETIADRCHMLPLGDPRVPGVGDDATLNERNPDRVVRVRVCRVFEIDGDRALVVWDDGEEQSVPLGALVRR